MDHGVCPPRRVWGAAGGTITKFGQKRDRLIGRAPVPSRVVVHPNSALGVPHETPPGVSQPGQISFASHLLPPPTASVRGSPAAGRRRSQRRLDDTPPRPRVGRPKRRLRDVRFPEQTGGLPADLDRITGRPGNPARIGGPLPSRGPACSMFARALSPAAHGSGKGPALALRGTEA